MISPTVQTLSLSDHDAQGPATAERHVSHAFYANTRVFPETPQEQRMASAEHSRELANANKDALAYQWSIQASLAYDV